MELRLRYERPPGGAPNIDLSPDALQTHLDTLVARIVGGKPSLPSVDSVPELVAQDESGAGEDPLPLDRGTLQTLLAVDGQRTVREIVAHRGSFDALWQLGNLAEVGLVRLGSIGSGRPAAPVAEPAMRLMLRGPRTRVRRSSNRLSQPRRLNAAPSSASTTILAIRSGAQRVCTAASPPPPRCRCPWTSSASCA